MKWTSRIATGAVGIALIGGAAVVLRVPPLQVDVASVVRAPLDQTIVNDGRVRVRERYTVSAPVAGTLPRIGLTEGDAVEPGAVVARLLPLASPLLDPELRAAAEQRLASAIDASAQATTMVTGASIASDQARKDLVRADSLERHGAIAPLQLEQAANGSRTRDAELASARFAASVTAHAIEEARALLARFTPGTSQAEQFEITSPVRGQVLHVLQKSGGVVAPGTALLEIGDPHAVELVADVLSQDAVDIRPGMSARIVHWGGNDTLTATVRRIEPTAFTATSALGVDEQRVNVVLDPEGAPARWHGLGDGFAVEIDITIWSKPDVIQIPTSALFRQGTDWAVFAVVKGKAVTRRVTVGHRGPLSTEVVNGLQPTAVVVIHPGSAVRDGGRVGFRAQR